MAPRNSLISCQPQFYVAAAFALIIVPLPWLTAWICASMVHELGHVMGIYLCAGRITGIYISLRGIRMEATGTDPVKRIFSSFLGPACGAVLLSLSASYPRLALCALIQTAFNMLPIYPLDGGRIVHSLLEIFFSPAVADKISNRIGLFTILLICFFSVYFSFLHHAYWLLFLWLSIYVLYNIRKIPCKPCRHRVQ